MKRIVVAGASRGLGAALSRHLSSRAEVMALSRGHSDWGSWLPCDLADPAQIASVTSGISGPLDALIVVAGIWETEAFSPTFSLAGSSGEEIDQILAVNLRAPILLAKALASKLQGGRIVLIGSTSGLDNIGTPEVAYNASKAGLRGVAQALARALRGQEISVSILNPGDIGTEEVLQAKRDGSMRPDGSLLPADLLAAVDFLLALSPSASFCEINLIPLS